ncbi:MAG: PBSX family phage terminase large subunit [Methanobacterium sp.]
MNPAFYASYMDNHPLQIEVGGANSSKSYTVAQKVILKTILSNRSRWLAIRKVKKDVKHSVYDTMRDIICDRDGFNLEGLFKFNNSESSITCKLNNSDILGVGLDDVNKLKSIKDPTGFWFDEADQGTFKDVQQLRLRLRTNKYSNENLQGILSLNPIHIQHWIKTELIDKMSKNDPDIYFHHSTYLDNMFLSEKVKRYMESITDPYFKKVYVLGEWGVYGNTVFDNIVIEDFDYGEDDLENVFTGMDFGTVHASAIERGGFKDGDLYSFDELWGKGWTNTDFIQAAEDYWEGQIGHSWYVTADSAEPDRIEEFRRAGWNVNPAKKGPGSLGYGVSFLKSRTWHIHKTFCPNLAREAQQFKRKEDKFGEPTEGFVELNDDGIAATRYGTETMWHPSYFLRNIDEENYGVSADDLGL